eukprot:3937811-Rhodomonas_salina.1
MVSDCQSDASLIVEATLTADEYSAVPIPWPEMETETDPVLGLLLRFALLTTGPVYETASVPLPTIDPAVIATRVVLTAPAASWHRTEVSDTQSDASPLDPLTRSCPEVSE